MHCPTPFYRELEPPWILVSAWVLKPIPHRYLGAAKFLRSQKLYADFSCARGTPNLCIVQGSPVVGDKAGELLEAQVMQAPVCTAASLVFQCQEEPLKTFYGRTEPSVWATSGTEEGGLKGVRIQKQCLSPGPLGSRLRGKESNMTSY